MNLLSFKTAIRNLQKDKYQSFLNIFGLALGFAAFLYISTYFFQENNYDQFHSKSDHLYRIVTKVKMGDTRESLSNSESPIAFTAKKEIPEVIDATRFFYRNNIVVQVEDQKYLEKTFWYADANVFQLFDFNLLEGDINEALSKPYTVVITKDLSKKYFGDANPIGKTIELTDDGNTYEITGILDDIPASSHLQFGMLASLSTADFSSDYNIYQWGNFRDLFSYVLLENDVDLKTMNQKLQDFTIGYYVPMMKRVGIDYNEFEKNGNFVIHSFQPLKDIHLGTTFIDKAIVHGNKQLLYALALIGIMVIVIASFNFINLGTARATLRAKEISIKKIVGSGKKKIVGQLLFETLLQCFLALGIALIILAICLSIFNSYTGLSFNFNQFFTITGTMSLLTILLVVVALTGVFPSLAISRYNPVDVIRGSVLNWNSKSGLRSVLVSFQFVIFIILVFGTIVVKRQVGLLHHQNPGFQKENILVVKNTNKLGNNRNAFKEELQKNPLVVDAAYSNSLPSMFDGSSNPFSKVDDKKNQIFLLRLLADEDFLNTMKIKLLNGRNFTNDFDIEKNNAIINQKAAEIFGWADCNNKIIYDFNDGGRNYNVIGIVDDFHLESLREHKRPMIIRYRSSGDYLSLRIRPESAS
ncbi:MAG: ABC transporter permease, partial [Prolixibacteraceae bacterium]|nr:ABC transporter permease [Prolixibacteraceae bacterium]